MSTYLNFIIRANSPHETRVHIEAYDSEFNYGTVTAYHGEDIPVESEFDDQYGLTIDEALIEAAAYYDHTVSRDLLIEIADICDYAAAPKRGDKMFLAARRTYPGADVLVVGNNTVINGEVYSPTGKTSLLAQAYLDGTIHGAVDEMTFTD